MKKLIILSLVITIFVELLLKLFVPLLQTGTKSNYIYDEDIGVKHKKNLRSIVFNDFIDETITNKYGSINFQDNFDNYDKIIFSIGDSNTKGVGVQFDESYPFQMFLELNTGNLKSNMSYGVINLGIQASGSIAAFKIYETNKSKIMKPDFVTHVGGTNDYNDDRYFESGMKHESLVTGSPRYFGLAGPISTIIEYSEILKRLKLTFSRYTYLVSINNNVNKLKNKKTEFNSFKEGFDMKTSKQYLKFKKVAKEDNFIFILSWIDGSGDKDTCTEYYNYVKNWASNNNILFADWCNDFKKIHRNINELPIINNHSSSHFRSWVNRIIASSFVEKILITSR